MRIFREIFLCLKTVLLISLILFILNGCEVPRDNPFDPWGSNYNPSAALTENEYEVSIYSTHEELWYPGEIFELHIEAEIYLPMPIDSIKAVYMDTLCYPLYFAFIGEMAPVWRTEILEDYLPNGEINELLGHHFNLRVYFSNGIVKESPHFWLARVIEYTPQTISPSGSDTTGSYPNLEWEQAELNFPFTYTINIMRAIGGVTQNYWTVEGLAGTITNYQVQVPLLNGTHVWTVTTVDEFNNQSTSTQTPFVVSNEFIP